MEPGALGPALAGRSFDRRLVDRFRSLPDPVIDLGGFEYLQHFEQGRLV
jgi:hypothetical protein